MNPQSVKFPPIIIFSTCIQQFSLYLALKKNCILLQGRQLSMAENLFKEIMKISDDLWFFNVHKSDFFFLSLAIFIYGVLLKIIIHTSNIYLFLILVLVFMQLLRISRFITDLHDIKSQIYIYIHFNSWKLIHTNGCVSVIVKVIIYLTFVENGCIL